MSRWMLLLPLLCQRSLHALRKICYVGFASIFVLCIALCRGAFDNVKDEETIVHVQYFKMPSPTECIARNVLEGSLTNPSVQCVGVTVNTSMLPAEERGAYLDAVREETGLPCVDPIADGCAAIVERINEKIG